MTFGVADDTRCAGFEITYTHEHDQFQALWLLTDSSLQRQPAVPHIGDHSMAPGQTSPGDWQADTSSALNSRVYVKSMCRVEYLAVSVSLNMVFTIGWVHTILRVARDQIKVGSPGDYF